MVHRIIVLPSQGSFFLFGPRQTGKSTLISSIYDSADVWSINLLKNEPFLLYLKDPGLFRRQAAEQLKNGSISTIFIDEIQRVPALLSEVHVLMDDFPDARFILTGSSARKLRRAGVDLLAGRAVERRLYPYVYGEIAGAFNLETTLRLGSLPPLFGIPEERAREILSTYVHTYLQQEIQAEGFARNLAGFSRFLEIAAAQNGERVSFSDVARETSLQERTVKSYYEILEDTLIVFRLPPWRRSVRKRLSGHPKFYFFDLGVACAANNRLTAPLDHSARGRAFEHFIIAETQRLLDYWRSEARMYYWRTSAGAEVDCVIEKHGTLVAACEIKSSPVINGPHTSGLRSFAEEYPAARLMVACTAERPYSINQIAVVPWQRYFEELRTMVG